MAEVSIISSGSARDYHLQHLLRCLFFISAKWGFIIVTLHIPGTHNTAADALSRNDLHRFFTTVSRALPTPSSTPPPPSLQALLLDTDSCWTSPAWWQRFKSIIGQGLAKTLREPTLPQRTNSSNSAFWPTSNPFP